MIQVAAWGRARNETCWRCGSRDGNLSLKFLAKGWRVSAAGVSANLLAAAARDRCNIQQ